MDARRIYVAEGRARFAELYHDVNLEQLKLDEHSTALEAARKEYCSSVAESVGKIAVANCRTAKAEASIATNEKGLKEDMDLKMAIEIGLHRAEVADLKKQLDPFAAETKQRLDDHDGELKYNER